MARPQVNDQLETLVRRAEHVIPEEELARRLDEGRPLRVKLGVDPTVQDVTLGWAVPLHKLREFQDEGHIAVLIVGDFTARIGDPSEKSETRPQLSEEVVKANAESCLAQLLHILSEDNLEVRYNSEWLEPLDLAAILRLTSYYTVAQMLERDDFDKRYKANRPISMVEFMYPLMQAYDSVAVRADVELGGNDQLFNLLVGRDIQRSFGQREQIALTLPLLIGTDGVQKMSQSLGNYISIHEKPNEMFGKLMSISDDLISQYASLAANLDDAQVADLYARARAGGPKAAVAKRRVARAVVALYHGELAAEDAGEAFDRTFKRHEGPADIAEVSVPRGAIEGEKVYLPRLLAELGMATSRSHARRLIHQRGVKINGEAVSGEELRLADVRGALLQVGKRRGVRLVG